MNQIQYHTISIKKPYILFFLMVIMWHLLNAQNLDSLEAVIESKESVEKLETVEFFAKKIYYKKPKKNLEYSDAGIVLAKQLDQFEKTLEAKINYDELSKDINKPEELYDISRRNVKQKLRENAPEKTLKQKKQLKEKSGSIYKWIAVGIALILALVLISLRIKKGKTIHKKPNSNGTQLKQEELKQLTESLQNIMVTKKPYLDKDLSLNELASLIRTSDKKMSILLNHHLNISFYDYINAFRIKEFIDQLKKEDNKNYSIEGIAFNSGFKSKSSFYRIFKKEMNMSPAAYKKSLRL